MNEPTEDTKGIAIGGWLILVGIGVVLKPILIAFTIPTYLEIFEKGYFALLTTPESAAYHPLWKPLMIGEMLINTIFFICAIYMTTLFFGKKRLFPKFFIIITVATFCIVLLDAVLLNILLPGIPFSDSNTLKEIMRATVAMVIWCPYMILSQRVKDTFVK